MYIHHVSTAALRNSGYVQQLKANSTYIIMVITLQNNYCNKDVPRDSFPYLNSYLLVESPDY